MTELRFTTMTPPVSSTSNAATAIAPITEEEAALLADEQRVQQETDDLERLLAKKCKQREELSDKWKAVQMKREAETKVRARALVEVVVAEVRWSTKQANEHAKDLARKANKELQKSQSPAKGKRQLVSHSFFFFSGGGGAKVSIGKCDAGEGESHTGESEGYAGEHEDWGYEVEGEQVELVR